jgi:hypothetical protein
MADASDPLAEAVKEWRAAEPTRLPFQDAGALRLILARHGLAVVPVEPTNRMIDAAHRAWTPGVNHGEAHAIRYRAMLAASQEPQR